MPTTLATRSFHDAPLSFRLRFGVPLLLPSPRPQLPSLLSTQQLAQALAQGVTALAASDSLPRALETALAHSSHLLLQNQALVRHALHEAARGGVGSEEWFRRLQAQGGAGTNPDSASTGVDVDYLSFSVTSTSLIHAQPLQQPAPGSMRGVDVAGRPLNPTASRAGHAHTGQPQRGGAAAGGGGGGSDELAALGRVATAARSRDVLSAAAPYALLPDVSASLARLSAASGQRGGGGNPVAAAQERARLADDTLAQGRAHYVLRPCVCLYSSKPLPTAARLQAELRAQQSASVAEHGAGGLSSTVLSGGAAPPPPPRVASSVSSLLSLGGPRAWLHVNFDGDFRFPLESFRPVKNATL